MTPSASTSLTPTEIDYLSTGSDVGTLRWDQPHCLLTFDSPTLIRFMHHPSLMEYVVDRVHGLPVRCSFAKVLDASTAAGWRQGSTDAVSSTDLISSSPDFVQRMVSGVFAAAADETFEDGIESDFSRNLVALLKSHGNAAVAAMEQLLASPMTNVEAAVESLKWLGAIEHDASHQYRRALLQRLLASPSSRIRYGAALGLAAMDDPASLVSLTKAIEREAHPKLRHYFKLVVDQLEATRQCLAS